MLKISELIDSLTLEDKLNIIIKDKNENLGLEDYGIETKKLFFKNMNSENLALSVVKNSWDPEAARIVGALTAKEFYDKGEDNVNVIPALSLYSKNDEYFTSSTTLLGNMTSAFVRGLNDNGMLVAPMLFLNELDNPNLSERIQNEIYLKPLSKLVDDDAVEAIYLRASNLSERNFCEIAKEKLNYNGILFIEDENPRNAIKRLKEGYSLIVTYKTSAIRLLLNAVEKYNECYEKLCNNLISQDDFNQAIEDCEILNIECIDKALTGLITYLINKNDHLNNLGDGEVNVILEKAFAESSILVKNENNLLPLQSHFETLFIGDKDAIFGYDKIKYRDCFPQALEARGYDIAGLNDEEFNEKALAKITKNSVIVMLLTIENNQVPANQIALMKKLYMSNRPVVAILPDLVDDFNFETYCKSILICNSHPQLLMNLLLGKLTPSGRLPRTISKYCDGVKKLYLSLGDGVTYSDIEYSNLIVNIKSIRFTIANRGLYPAYETVQLYIGLPNSQDKELKYFDKVYLEPGECKIVDIPLLFSFFEFYNEGKHDFEATLGRYNIYIGSSYSKTIFTTSIDLNERHELTIDEANQKLITSRDYLEEVIADKFSSKPKESSFLSYKTKKVLLIISTIYLNLLFIAGIVISVLNHAFITSYIVLGAFMLIVNIVLILLFIFLHKSRYSKVSLSVDYNNVVNDLRVPNYDAELERREIERIKQEEERKRLEEERIEEERRLQEEARLKAEQEEKARLQQLEDDEPEIVVNAVSVFSNSITLSDLLNNLDNYLKEHSLIVEKESIASFISALASSKAIILNNEDESISLMFANLVTDFFKQEHFVFDLDSVESYEDLLYKDKENTKPTKFLKGIISASKNSDDFSFNILDNVTSNNINNLGEIKDSLIANKKNLELELKFIPTGNSDNKVILTNNEYFLLIMRPDEKAISNELQSFTCYIELVARIQQTDEKAKEYDAISYSNFNSLVNVFGDTNLVIYEDNWKKLDNVIEKINEHSYYQYDDLEFKRFEEFSMAYLQMENNEMNALDALTQAYVIPRLNDLKDLISLDEGLVYWFDQEYGGDYINLTSKAIKSLSNIQ